MSAPRVGRNISQHLLPPHPLSLASDFLWASAFGSVLFTL